MKVLLIFPPQAQPFLPHQATGQLKAVLKDEGIDAVQKDLNLEAYEDFLSDISVKEAINELRNRKEYFVPEKYYKSIEIIEKNLYSISKTCNTLIWSLKNYKISGYSPSSSLDILKATEDRTSNIFIDYFEHEIEAIKKEKPDIIGISIAWSSQIIPAFTLARIIKKHMPSVHISMGGSMIGHLADYIEDNQNMFLIVDSYIPFEGEKGIVKLAKELKKKNFSDVPGLIYKYKERIIKNPSEIHEELNSIPLPDFDDLPLDRYYSPQIYIPISASRSCYWGKCTFCSHHLSGMKFRKKDPRVIFNEMNFYYTKYRCRNFYFVDDSLPPLTIKALAEKIAKEEKPYRWAGEIRMEKDLTEDYFKILHNGGCRLLLFGMESYSERILDLINKGFAREMAEKIIKYASMAGIITWIFFFIGFPGEEEFEARETFDFIIRNRKYIDMIGCGPFVLTRNSPIYKNMEKFPIKQIRDNTEQDLQLSYPALMKHGIQRSRIDDMMNNFFSKPETEKFLKPFVSEPHLLFFRKSHF